MAQRGRNINVKRESKKVEDAKIRIGIVSMAHVVVSALMGLSGQGNGVRNSNGVGVGNDVLCDRMGLRGDLDDSYFPITMKVRKPCSIRMNARPLLSSVVFVTIACKGRSLETFSKAIPVESSEGVTSVLVGQTDKGKIRLLGGRNGDRVETVVSSPETDNII